VQARGLDPQHAGLVLTARPVVMMVLAPIAGTASDRIGAPVLTSALEPGTTARRRGRT
jgi:hypothetical protein